ncbi:hypothetical protein B9479_007601 [Cryptococcus floricola]|uniref:AB hydrolase-1 domain-containing protein n=1 Tax=Cryptococcus floricola TaxID=2591691 RepID=A0A5D3AQ45_9TREE|nr:hypothetical protein B9479_007601 [Cryptococcus floricola]
MSRFVTAQARGIALANVVALLAGLFLWYRTPPSLAVSITSRSEISCGDISHPTTSGYVHLAGGSLFFSLIQAREEAKNDGLVIYFEGGPGASAMDYPFLGAGPCQLTSDGGTTLSPAPYPWTDYANLLILEYPIPTGWSYNRTDQTPHHSSAGAAEDFDDFLQAFLREFPQFIRQPLIISTLSYGGTTSAHIASTLVKRNKASGYLTRRIPKIIDQLVLGNPFNDVESVSYQNIQHLCHSDPPVLSQSVCDHLSRQHAPCFDLLLPLLNPSTSHLSTRASRRKAWDVCVAPFEMMWKDISCDRHDRRKPPCWPPNTCMWWSESLKELMNSAEMRKTLGVPDHITWNFIGYAHLYFVQDGDNLQASYHLLPEAIEAGTRVLVYSGMNDTVLPYENAAAWMAKLPSPHLPAFQSDPIPISIPPSIPIPSTSTSPGAAGGLTAGMQGVVKNPGGDVTLVGIAEAGHMVEADQPEVLARIIGEAVKGRCWDPLR